ncbi:MAG: flagellar motor switch phosphatase FliY [Xylanivirga thermophila]|jgi:flagellar motor switch protein FliN|uniref:flagellar motor switch phosphatase FliY n=1 Tax=Xylanivirga thermophila TaxID=2496273 RepID=UPI00101DAE45|nr:flagellar motor switch phosphatase FliY [Xylanivirga thermophila]
MNDILSQEEIDALLNGAGNLTEENSNNNEPIQTEQTLSFDEMDALGEIGNISMGTAATTLSTLLQKKVTITTPEVTITTLKELASQYPVPFVAVEVSYTNGLEGTNLLIIDENDVKIITDLMMGGDGTNTEGELNDLHLSAVGEVMNQMIGSSSTSLATMLNKSINISPPKAFAINFAESEQYDYFDVDEPIVKINFKMEVGNLINSYMMQLLPIEFAKDLVNSLLNVNQTPAMDIKLEQETEKPQMMQKQMRPPQSQGQQIEEEVLTPDVEMTYNEKNPVDVHPIAFQPLQGSVPSSSAQDTGNIDLILDVPLQVSVELGRTKKLIKDILDLNSGSIIELDKMAGEPVDILVNGKLIAKGEVVVIEDSFGVRITDIISPNKRISRLG